SDKEVTVQASSRESDAKNQHQHGEQSEDQNGRTTTRMKNKNLTSISREDRWETDKNNHKTQTNNKRALKRKKSAPKPPNNKQQRDKGQEKKTVIQKGHRDVQQENYNVPIDLLDEPPPKSTANHLWIKEQQSLLDQTLKHFRVRANVVQATQGPAVTRFEVQPEMGVKVSKIRNLSDDLKLNMSAKDIRIEAPIPGNNTVGIEVPNPKPQMVGLREIFATDTFTNNSSPLTIALGLSIEGTPVATNIQKMPHGLIAGATGSGKSVCINSILISLLYKASPEEVKFLLIDPKMVELAPYNGIPHLVSPVITDVKAATAALKWAVNEMEDRYMKFVEAGVRNIEGYN